MTSSDSSRKSYTFHERKVWLTSDELAKVIDLLPSNLGRHSLVSTLIRAYGLTDKIEDLIRIPAISDNDLKTYHEKSFIDCVLRQRLSLDQSAPNANELLKLLNRCQVKANAEDMTDDTDETNSNGALCELHGLSYDCYPFPFMGDYVRVVAASTIACAKTLIRVKSNGCHNVVINWMGGRHHCSKRRAAGFCYINDIILGISALRKSFAKVFYLDLDLHHGDGVEKAFQFSKNVQTCSVHRFDVGFYPGTGSLESSKPGHYNIPLKKGLCDDNLMQVAEEIILPMISKFNPEVVIIQAGCDGLATDTHKEWNLTISGFSKVIEFLVDKVSPIPIMILGGGGYNHTETAKCWTYITKMILQNYDKMDLIPDHPLLDSYEDDGFQFWTTNNSNPSRMKNENTESYIEELKESLLNFI